MVNKQRIVHHKKKGKMNIKLEMKESVDREKIIMFGEFPSPDLIAREASCAVLQEILRAIVDKYLETYMLEILDNIKLEDITEQVKTLAAQEIIKRFTKLI